MKSVITATGIDQINSLLKEQHSLHILDIDIHRQELLWEKLADEEICRADVLVIMDVLEGPFSKNELIKEVRKQFKNEIFIILEEAGDEQFVNLLRSLKITNIYSVDDNPGDIIDAIAYEHLEAKPSVEKESGNVVERVEKVYIQKKVISIIGPGGVGKTTVAMNLAGVLAKEKYEVCLLDLNLEKSDLGYVSGADEKGLQDIIKKDLTEDIIMNAVTEKKGIYYFTGLKDLLDMNDAQKLVKAVIKVLKKRFDALIIDTGNMSSPATHIAITEADHQVLIITTAERVLKSGRKFLKLYTDQLEIKLNCVGLINQAHPSQYEKKDYEEMLEIEIAGSIGYDKRIFIGNEKGELMARNHEIKAFIELKNRLIEKPVKKGLFKKRRV